VRKVETIVTDDLDSAVQAAAQNASGAETVVFSPLFPVSLDDRSRFANLIGHTAA
jgi:hypothetical protein